MWAFPLLPFRSRTEVQFQSLRAKGAGTYWPHVTCPAKRQIPIGQPFILPYRCCLMLLLGLLLLHPFNGLFSRTTWVSRHQKGKTSEDLNRQEIMGFGDAVASAGPYANNMYLAPGRQPHQHLIIQFHRPDGQQCQSTVVVWHAVEI